MKQYRVLCKDSKEARNWWPPESYENGWFPFEEIFNTYDEAKNFMNDYRDGYPQDVYKIQEREYTPVEWSDCD